MKDIRQRLLATFQIEHRDHIDQIRSLLAMIERTGAQGPELDEVFRRAHSLKGAARAVDLPPVEGLAHRLETLLSRVRQGSLAMDKAVSAVVQQALDASEDCVMALNDHRPTPGFEPALQALEKLLETQPEPGDPSPELDCESRETLSSGQLPSGKPPSAELSTGAPRSDGRTTGQPQAGESVTGEAAEANSTAPFQPLDVVRVTAENFDGLLRSAAGYLGETQRQAQLFGQLHELSKQMTSLEKDADRIRRQLPVGPEFGRIRAYLDSSRRQVQAIAGQARSARRLQQRSSWAIHRLGQQLQLDVWRARMVPSEGLLEGYRKTMRDLARDEQKDVAFSATSTGVHADRRVLQALKAPVLHLLRNALSHGIETPRERIGKGKAATGLVSLQIGSAGHLLTITIEDDGRGVDVARAIQAARVQGMLSESEAATCSLERLAHILFQPGFSTAPKVTELSGRGMGLSVVYETVRRLQGSVELLPRDGGGTVIRMALPLSIATHKLLLVDCGGRAFALPIHTVERLHRIRMKSITTLEGRPVVPIDGQPIPIVSLHAALDLSPVAASPHQPEANRPAANMVPVVVLRLKRGLTAVAVDAFLWENDAVIQDLGSAARRGIAGAVLLDDGTIAMVLNPEELLSGSDAHRTAFPIPVPQPKVERSSILVVDDSMTTRTLEKSILEAHGYRVRVAVDGVDALACLRRERPDLVITDVQMPRMDGFVLLANMKEDSGLSKIPVIVVTSLERREDQEQGLRLGADAYIVKGKFDQGELLATIRQIL